MKLVYANCLALALFVVGCGQSPPPPYVPTAPDLPMLGPGLQPVDGPPPVAPPDLTSPPQVQPASPAPQVETRY